MFLGTWLDNIEEIMTFSLNLLLKFVYLNSKKLFRQGLRLINWLWYFSISKYIFICGLYIRRVSKSWPLIIIETRYWWTWHYTGGFKFISKISSCHYLGLIILSIIWRAIIIVIIIVIVNHESSRTASLTNKRSTHILEMTQWVQFKSILSTS